MEYILTTPGGCGSEEIPLDRRADQLTEIPTDQLMAIHDRAGPLQREVLIDYPATLPVPLRDDLEYYDGAQFFLLHIAKTLEDAGHEPALTQREHLLLNATNGVNDWWIDESGWEQDGARDYDSIVEAFDGINAVCYSYLNPETDGRSAIETDNPEVQHVIEFYDYALSQMPAEHRPALAKLLISINLYQGVSLYQEKGFREHMLLDGLTFEGRDISQAELRMLDRMRVEKGGFIFTYLWPYFPELSDSIVIPDEPPTIEGAIDRFLEGQSLYSQARLGRRLLEVGGIVQLMDDSCDREEDWNRGVVSPENVGPAFAARQNENWGDMVDRVLGELTALMDVEHEEGQLIAVHAAATAVAGLTRYRAHRYGAVVA